MAFEIAFFSAKKYDETSFNKYNVDNFANFTFFTESISPEFFESQSNDCKKFDGVCVFVNDVVDKEMIKVLVKHDIKVVLNRCAGFDRVDVAYAAKKGIACCRVPAYSPYAVAEQAVSLLLTLNRKLHIADRRTRSGNFSIDGLQGMDIFGKTVGVIGTGKIGQILIDIMTGFGCKIAAYDVYVNPTYAEKPNVTYMTLDELLATSDIISIHSPLLPSTKHMINKETISKMKDGVILINCARGGLINTEDMIEGLVSGKVGGAGLDVYENEAGIFFNDCTNDASIMKDSSLATLMAMNNVLISAHQAFLTEEALEAIAKVTLHNAKQVSEGKKEKELDNWVAPEMAQ